MTALALRLEIPGGDVPTPSVKALNISTKVLAKTKGTLHISFIYDVDLVRHHL